MNLDLRIYILGEVLVCCKGETGDDDVLILHVCAAAAVSIVTQVGSNWPVS